jgi:hypothetical protein
MTMDDAYAVQKALVALKIADGRRVIGWKIGLTSKAMQYALNIDIPDSGILFDDMYFEDGATVPAGRFIQPRIEAEIAFVMKADLEGAAGAMRCWQQRTMSAPRWKFSIRGLSALMRKPGILVKFLIRFPTMPRMLASSWAARVMIQTRLICAGLARFAAAMRG